MQKPFRERMETLRKHQADHKEPLGITRNDQGTNVLPLKSIKTAVGVFQPRSIATKDSELHIESLSKAISMGHELPPITIWWSGQFWYVVDGHHRKSAFERWSEGNSGRSLEAIPVEVFEGTLEEAMAFAAGANSRNKLPMDQGDKLNMSWRMVCCTSLSKKQIADACAVGTSTVARQRNALRKFLEDAQGDKPEEFKDPEFWGQFTWRDVKQRLDKPRVDFDADAELRKKAAKISRRLYNEHGKSLSVKPEVFAAGIAMYDKRLPEKLIRSDEWMETLEVVIENPSEEPQRGHLMEDLGGVQQGRSRELVEHIEWNHRKTPEDY